MHVLQRDSLNSSLENKKIHMLHKQPLCRKAVERYTKEIMEEWTQTKTEVLTDGYRRMEKALS